MMLNYGSTGRSKLKMRENTTVLARCDIEKAKSCNSNRQVLIPATHTQLGGCEGKNGAIYGFFEKWMRNEEKGMISSLGP